MQYTSNFYEGESNYKVYAYIRISSDTTMYWVVCYLLYIKHIVN